MRYDGVYPVSIKDAKDTKLVIGISTFNLLVIALTRLYTNGSSFFGGARSHFNASKDDARHTKIYIHKDISEAANRSLQQATITSKLDRTTTTNQVKILQNIDIDAKAANVHCNYPLTIFTLCDSLIVSDADCRLAILLFCKIGRSITAEDNATLLQDFLLDSRIRFKYQ